MGSNQSCFDDILQHILCDLNLGTRWFNIQHDNDLLYLEFISNVSLAIRHKILGMLLQDPNWSWIANHLAKHTTWTKNTVLVYLSAYLNRSFLQSLETYKYFKNSLQINKHCLHHSVLCNFNIMHDRTYKDPIIL